MIKINMLAGLLGNWLSGSPEGAMGVFMKGIRTLCFSLCTFIYGAIIYLYNIFERLCGGRFLDSQILEAFARRLGLILGLVMAFIVIFSLIKMVLDPEKLNDKEMGAVALVRKIILVIIMLAFSNFLFNLLYHVQRVVLEENIISNLLLPIRVDEEKSDNFGNILAEELMISFYQIEEHKNEDGSKPTELTQCESLYNEFRNQIIRNGNFSLGYECLNESLSDDSSGVNTESFIVYFNWLLSVGVGLVVAYFIFCYCISVGIRMIQLMFLEIIAPMAIVSYVLPKKETMFSKWRKLYIGTYLDVFIRVVIINFVVFLIATMFTAREGFVFWDSVGGEPDSLVERGFITAIIIMALLSFAKKAPELIKNLFGTGDSGIGFGMSSPKGLFSGMLGGAAVLAGAKMATVGTAIGAGGALTSGISRYRMNMKGVDKSDKKALWAARGKGMLAGTGGAFMAYGRGLKAGATSKGNVFSSINKGITAQKGIDDKYDELVASGGSSVGVLTSKVASHFGMTEGQIYERRIKDNEAIIKTNDDIKKFAEDLKVVKHAKGDYDAAVASGDEKKIAEMLKRYKTIKKRAITQALTDPSAFKNPDDAGTLAKIKLSADELSNLVSMHNITLKDAEGNKVVDFKNADVLESVAAAATIDISNIKNPTKEGKKYNAAVANDKHAGVKDNGKK